MNENIPIYWIGNRESELIGTMQMFKGSITTYGSGNGTNYAFDKHYGYRFDNNSDNEEWLAFVNETTQHIINKEPECYFMPYYPADFPYYGETLKNRMIGVNSYELISLLENKIQTRLWLSDIVTLTPFFVTDGRNLNGYILKQRFPDYTNFVIQAESSCCGNGTWLVNETNESDILNNINISESYTISPYILKNIPLNVHLIIYKSELVVLPPSVQIISTEHGTFCYHGADFFSYKQLGFEIQNKVKHYAVSIGNRLQKTGYRGVCGIDFITDGHEVFFMEINSRFQASTMLINKALGDAGANVSVQELHLDAFTNVSCSYKLPEFEVNYSFLRYRYDKNYLNILTHLYSIQKECLDFLIRNDDGLDWDMRLQNNSYLFDLIFRNNITCISPEYICLLHANLKLYSGFVNAQNWESKLHELKIILMTHGIRINIAAEQQLHMAGGINYKEFGAIDLILNNLYINVPYGVQMSRLSPFEICLDNNKYVLCYLGEHLAPVTLRLQDPLGKKILKSGFTFEQIAYLGHDRLRIYHRHSCYYKQKNLGCGFCDIDQSDAHFSFDDIKRVIDEYIDHPAIRHYMIGGGSNIPSCDFSYIINIAKYIRSKTKKPICLMSSPPLNIEIITALNKAGITEVAFNLEVFDRDLAVQYMPGKSIITLQQYKEAFIQALKLMGNEGNVRCAFIVGLESKESLLQGIDFICKLGVWPVLSLLKPIECTPLYCMLPPADEDIFAICQETEKICKYYGVGLAPLCRYCEDNTLKITL